MILLFILKFFFLIKKLQNYNFFYKIISLKRLKFFNLLINVL